MFLFEKGETEWVILFHGTVWREILKGRIGVNRDKDRVKSFSLKVTIIMLVW